ncbi:MAG: HEAT repeat domain-containing protein [Chloroflexi bacterium]|nr:HEAT repeat domain-containing protein [Chloroflexota bacterium]
MTQIDYERTLIWLEQMVRGDVSARREAVEAFLAVGPAALPHLKQIVVTPDLNGGIRWDAADMMAEYGEIAIPDLVETLEDTRGGGAWFSADALPRFREKILEPVGALLHQHPNPEVRHVAAFTLAFTKARSTLPALSHALVHDPDPAVRAGVIRSLRVVYGGEPVEALAAALSDQVPGVVQQAAYSLKQIGTEQAQRALVAWQNAH